MKRSSRSVVGIVAAAVVLLSPAAPAFADGKPQRQCLHSTATAVQVTPFVCPRLDK